MKDTETVVVSARMADHTPQHGVRVDAIEIAEAMCAESRWLDRHFNFESRYGFTLAEAKVINQQVCSGELTAEEAEAAWVALARSRDIAKSEVTL